MIVFADQTTRILFGIWYCYTGVLRERFAKYEALISSTQFFFEAQGPKVILERSQINSLSYVGDQGHA